jgi:hypothetical protein
MQVREHRTITEKMLRQPYYFTRWFFCVHGNCSTRQVMAERYKVLTDVGSQRLAELDRQMEQENELADREAEIAAASNDIIMQITAEVPWE